MNSIKIVSKKKSFFKKLVLIGLFSNNDVTTNQKEKNKIKQMW